MPNKNRNENLENTVIQNREAIEEVVRVRTAELSRLNEELKWEIAERKKAEEQLEQRTHLLSTLLDVSNIISSNMELKPLLEAILDRLKKIIDYNGAEMFSIEGDIIKVVAHRSQMTESELANYVFSFNNATLSREIVISKKAVLIPDIRSDKAMMGDFREIGKNACEILGLESNKTMVREFNEILSDYLETSLKDSRSWLALPLIVKDKVIGVLTIDHTEPGYYKPHHAELGMVFANQAAIEFENVRLYNETMQKADELKTMFAVQQAITSRLEKDDVLKLIADEARRLTNSERTAVFLVDGNDLLLSVFSGKDSFRFLGYRLPINESEIGKSLKSGNSVIVNKTERNQDIYKDLVEKASVKSFLSIPLLAGSRPIGTITVVDKVTGEFDVEDERILKMLASSAVIGLENARLYNEEKLRHMEDEQRRHVAEGLRDILTIMNSNRPIGEILDFIINQAVRVMGTDTGAIYRLQGDQNLLKIEAAVGLPEEYKAQMTIPLGKGVVGRAVVERKPIAVSDIAEQIVNYVDDKKAKETPFLWLADHIHGVLAVPLVCKDEVYGGIVLYYSEIWFFSKDEIDLAMTFADQVALALDNSKLRAQAEEMAVASERSRLARDLHDAVTQTLFSASLIAEVLPKIWQRNPDEGWRRIEEIRQLTRGALAEMRTLLLELRPAALVESGLKELLNQLTQAVTGRSRIPIALKISGQLLLPTDVKIALYRIAQETLNNISKHSGANNVSLCVRTSESNNIDNAWAELRISDNGRGFDMEGISSEHLGLGIMRERAETVDAELYIDSKIGEGTTVTVRWGFKED